MEDSQYCQRPTVYRISGLAMISRQRGPPCGIASGPGQSNGPSAASEARCHNVERSDDSDNQDCLMNCMLYLSQIFYTIITLVPRVRSLDLYILLHIHDVLNTGQISPGYPHPQDLTAP